MNRNDIDMLMAEIFDPPSIQCDECKFTYTTSPREREHHNDDKSDYLYNIIFQNSEDENICQRHNYTNHGGWAWIKN